MKIVLRIILFVAVVLIVFGFYSNFIQEGQGEKFIGYGVLIFAFILMPLFIYHRYNGKDLSRYSMRNMFQEKEDTEGRRKKKEDRNETID